MGSTKKRKEKRRRGSNYEAIESKVKRMRSTEEERRGEDGRN